MNSTVCAIHQFQPELSVFLRRYVPRSWFSKVRKNRRHTLRSVEDFCEHLVRKRLVQIE